MNADPIEIICANLKDRLQEIRESKVVGRIVFEAHVNQGGIGDAKIKVNTEETWNLKSNR